ncbi:N-formylglutamate amidohydrolase [Parasphingorhabdus sp. JC815]|uniref:N-formylglutamate amidohydrolase n=1 Tax=Parasphingorhabdus sp. JC815 TaxID=3232140 RepID=UPI00345A873C
MELPYKISECRTAGNDVNLSENSETRPWDFFAQNGPVITTAIHAGHSIRYEILPWLEISEADRLREEDPMTDYFLGVGDSHLRANQSRFEVDLNRPREKAISTNPDDQWGLTIWNSDLPKDQIEKSMQIYDEFYAMIRLHCDKMIERYGRILLLDIHSYNHRRDGADAPAAPKDENPDIDLGATTMNHSIYGKLLNRMAYQLGNMPVCGRLPDVGVNVRWKDGGHFPEWLHKTYGDDACVITLEYKKSFMDEWTGQVDILALQHLREGLFRAVDVARDSLRHMTKATL